MKKRPVSEIASAEKGSEKKIASSEIPENTPAVGAPSWDDDAVAAFYTKFGQSALNLLSKKGLPPDEALSVFHDVLMSELKELSIDDPRFVPFMFRRLRNRASTAYGRLCRDKEHVGVLCESLGQLQSDPVDDLPSDWADRLNAALKILKPKDQEILRLLYCEGYTSAEVASKSGANETTVRVRAWRKRCKLRLWLTRSAAAEPK